MKLRYIDELDFESKHDKKIVKSWLQSWIKFIEQEIDYNVRKCDFKNNDFFFFTSCSDILNNPRKVNKRKRDAVIGLFLRQISGEQINIIKDACTTCGNPSMDIDGLNGGFYHYCRKCGKLVLHSTINEMSDCFNDLAENINKNKEKWMPIQNVKT